MRDRYGTLDVVELRDVERPEPIDDQVLVRVRAASVNRADLDSLGPKPGFARLFMGLRAPRLTRLGVDVAGVVEAIGPGVTRFTPGDRVFADLFSFGTGSFAEYAAASEAAFLPIPAGMSFEDAATLPHSAVLAVQGLRLRNGRTIRPGAKVLIDGASGNVGPFAVQVAKSMGAEVTGVCRTEKLDFVRSLGVDHVIDFTSVDYTRTGERYDWIVDTDSPTRSPASAARCDRAAPTSRSAARHGRSSGRCCSVRRCRAAVIGGPACCCGGSRSRLRTYGRSATCTPRARSSRRSTAASRCPRSSTRSATSTRAARRARWSSSRIEPGREVLPGGPRAGQLGPLMLSWRARQGSGAR